MDSVKFKRMAVLLVAGGILGTFYSNCAKKLPAEAVEYSSLQPTPSSSTSQMEPLIAMVVPDSVPALQSAQVSVTGGQKPYTFKLLSDVGTTSATIDGNGQIRAPAQAGNVIIQITDSAEQTSEIALNVQSPIPGTGASCRSPWGGTDIPDAQSVLAASATTIYCPSTDTCKFETRVCKNGFLSGSNTNKDCSTVACKYKVTSTSSSGAACGQYSTGSFQGGTNYAYTVPMISSANQLPATCTAAQYGVSKYCSMYSTGTFQGGSYSTFTVYTCESANPTSP